MIRPQTKVQEVACAIERERSRWSMSRGRQSGAWLAMRRADSGALAVVESLPGPTMAARMRFDTLVSLAGGRAAIEAMREPTNAMVEAGAEAIADVRDETAEATAQLRVCDAWAAMHAAALVEEQPA